MIMRKSIQDRLRLTVLLMVACSLGALAGCGTDAPFGSTVTIEKITEYTPPQPWLTQDQKYVAYRVSVFDPAGNPMNGIVVDLRGHFSDGSTINMNGAIGSAPMTLVSTLEMYAHGYRDFTVSAPTLSFRSISAPATVNVTPQAGAGSLGNGSYRIAVTARDAAGGQAAPLATVSAVLSDGTFSQAVLVSWTPVTGAAGYNVYGDNGALGPLLLSSTVTGTSYVYGSVAGGAAFPGFGFNSTGRAANTVSGTLQVFTGSANISTGISF